MINDPRGQMPNLVPCRHCGKRPGRFINRDGYAYICRDLWACGDLGTGILPTALDAANAWNHMITADPPLL